MNMNQLIGDACARDFQRFQTFPTRTFSVGHSPQRLTKNRSWTDERIYLYQQVEAGR